MLLFSRLGTNRTLPTTCLNCYVQLTWGITPPWLTRSVMWTFNLLQTWRHTVLLAKGFPPSKEQLSTRCPHRIASSLSSSQGMGMVLYLPEVFRFAEIGKINNPNLSHCSTSIRLIWSCCRLIRMCGISSFNKRMCEYVTSNRKYCQNKY
eukprot:PhF_6_TR15675/c0_g1_i2/m.24373